MKALPLAIAAVAAGPAIAQQTINGTNTGQVLMYPFYSTQNDSNTYMHVVNNTNEQKAVKLRFMEGQGSSVVLEFNVYLDAYDIFPFALASNDFGGASVLATDPTCTVPELGTSNPPYDGTQSQTFDGGVLKAQPFVPYQYENEENGDISRTLIGHAEVIEMGVVDDSIDVSDCDAIHTLWTSGAWASNTATNVAAPSGGLSGSSLFINPELAYSMDLSVVAIDGWAKAATNYHTGPGTLSPALGNGVTTATVDGLTLDYTSKTNGAVLATSALLASSAVYNEVMVADTIAGETDWVLTFPTKRYLNGVAPFTKAYDDTKADGGACEELSLVRRDRNSNSSNGTGTFVPAEDGIEDTVCMSVQVLSFNGKSALITDTNKAVSYSFQEGAATLSAEQSFPADDNGVVVSGLPVIGFSATRIVNGVMSYGYSQDHKTHKTNVVSSS